MNSMKGTALANNRVGSKQNLNEDDYKDTKTTSATSIKGELPQIHHNNVQVGEQEYIQSSNDATEKLFQEGSCNEVIVKQPINKIKIVNVSYQKSLYKKNTVNQKRISISDLK